MEMVTLQISLESGSESFRENALGAHFEGQKESFGLRRRMDIPERMAYAKAWV